MKKFLLFIPLLLFSGSDIFYQDYVPLFMDREELESSVQLVDSALVITDPGRIYVYRNWLMLVENYKGIHLIDNTDPANPVRKGFLRVPGCQSLAVGNGTLYVDNAVDLVGIRLDPDAMTAVEVARNKKALPEIASPDGYIPWEYQRVNRPANTEIVGWTLKNATL
jgi:hypothetical protein